MRASASVDFGGRQVIVRELDVVQSLQLVRRSREQLDPSDLDLGNAFAFMPEFVLEEIIGQPLSELLTPGISHTELEALYQKALELNPFLARAMKNMAQMIEASQSMLNGSRTQLSDLLNEVTSVFGNTDGPPLSPPSNE